MPPSLARWLSPVLVLAAFVVLGCVTPAPLVRLAPNSSQIFWVSGRATVAREEGGVRVAVAFEHQSGMTLGLRVEVQNASAGQLDVDPREFTFTACGTASIDSCAPTRRVIDPEQVLAGLDERQSREEAAATGSQTLLGTLVILNAVGDIAAVASGHADFHTGQGTATAAALMASDAAARDATLSSISAQQTIWTNEALRRSTLVPGRGIGGRIYLPIYLDAQIVWLHVRSGGRVFSFPFRQVVNRFDVPSSAGPDRNDSG
jgi:hypothetical protein